MKNRERVVWIACVLLATVLYLNARQELIQVNSWVDKQNEQLLKLDSLLNDIDINVNSNSIIQDKYDWIFDSELRYLTENGLNNPVQQLKVDLTNRDDLIPVEGVLGGTMRIYSTDQIRILPGRFVFAVFEDGHVQGNLILQYEVKNGQISWEIIESSVF